MENKLRIFSLVLLFLLGSSAIGGGWMLVSDPSGNSMHLSIELLNQTPFDNYLLPGVILLVTLGFLSIIACILTIRQTKRYTLLVILQGSILFIWLTTEIILNKEFYYSLYHVPFYTISVMLIVIGIRLRLSVAKE